MEGKIEDLFSGPGWQVKAGVAVPDEDDIAFPLKAPTKRRKSVKARVLAELREDWRHRQPDRILLGADALEQQIAAKYRDVRSRRARAREQHRAVHARISQDEPQNVLDIATGHRGGTAAHRRVSAAELLEERSKESAQPVGAQPGAKITLAIPKRGQRGKEGVEQFFARLREEQAVPTLDWSGLA